VWRSRADDIDLVEGQDDPALALGQPGGDLAVALARRLVQIDQPQHHVGVVERLQRGLHHVLIQFVARVADEAGGVDEDDLIAGFGDEAQLAGAGGLRAMGDGGDLLAHEGVDQGALADIGAAGQGDKTRFMVGRGFVQLLVVVHKKRETTDYTDFTD
jgi:hypothetical protein